MLPLNEHIKKTIDLVDGYVVGNLVVEDGVVSIHLDNGELFELDDSFKIEVRNGDKYEEITVYDALNTKTAGEGWPLFAGLYARVKRK